MPLSFSFLDVVMLFIGRRVLLDDIVFVCLSVGITDVFVCFFRWFDGLRSIDLMCRCIMRKKSKLMFANVRLFHRVAHECLESLFFQLTLRGLDLRAFARVFRKFILSFTCSWRCR